MSTDRHAEPENAAPVLGELAQLLRSRGYAAAAVLPRPGGVQSLVSEADTWRRYRHGQHGGNMNSLFAPLYYRAMARRAPVALRLFRFFCLGGREGVAGLEELLGAGLMQRLQAQGLVTVGDGVAQSRIWATAYGTTICFHDPHTVAAAERLDFVWLGGCSINLADFVSGRFAGRRFARALDLCSGAGFQALCMAGQCGEVTATDVNERALRFAAVNSACNRVANVSFTRSDLFAAVDGRFDLVMANTPFVLMDEGACDTSGNGGRYGMEIALRLFEGLDRHLGDDGVAAILASSAIVGGRNLLVDRLREIFGHLRYRIEMFPLYEYYGAKHHRAYEAQGVERCILYLVSLERSAAPMSLVVHELGAVARLFYRAKIGLMRRLLRLGLMRG